PLRPLQLHHRVVPERLQRAVHRRDHRPHPRLLAGQSRRTIMQIARLAAVLAVLGAAMAVRADEGKPTFHAEKTSTVTSKVKAVDQKTRMMTLANDQGEVTFKADNRVKNLKQVKPGDVVTATLTESLDARVLKPGESVPA